MKTRRSLLSRGLSALLCAALLAAVVPGPLAFASDKPMLTLSSSIPSASGATPERVYGATRYETAVQISKKSWSAGSSQYVLLATGEGWADALIANPLAAALGAPILLTPPGSLSSAAWNEIQRLGATKIIILGGQAAVSRQVVTDLVNRGIALSNIERLGGADRYDTAVRVAERVMIHRGRPDKVVVATGQSYPDALAIAGYAARGGYPILLTRPTSLPSATSRELDVINPTGSVIVGGVAAVSDSVASKLPDAQRIGGTNRYDTARLIAEYAFSNGMTYENVVLSTGENYADALAAGPWVAKTSGMLVLTDSDTLSPETDEFFNNHCSSITNIYVAGGPAAVADSILGVVEDSAASLFNADEVEIMSPAAESALETIAPDGTLTFDDTVNPASIEPSSVLVGKPSDGAPEGFLRRVVSVTTGGGQVTVETVEATLADVILKGSIDITGTVPTEQPETPSGALIMSDAQATGSTSVDVDFDSMQMQGSRIDPRLSLGRAYVEFDEDLYGSGPARVSLSGNAELSADFTISSSFGVVRWKRYWWGSIPVFGLKEVKATAALSESMALELFSGVNLLNFEKTRNLAAISLPTVTIWVGAVPIVLKNTLTPYVEVEARLRAGLEVGISQWASCSLGVRWHYQSGWSAIKSSSSGSSFTVEGKVEAEATASLGLRLDIKLYGVAGPYFSPEAYLDFNASTSSNPWWTLDWGVRAGYGGSINVLGKKANFGWEYNLYGPRRIANAPGAFPSMTEAPTTGTMPVVGPGSTVSALPLSATQQMPAAIAAPILGDTVEASDFSIPGLTVTDAQAVDADTVRLTTTNQTPGERYTVSVTGGGIYADDGSASVASSKSFDGFTPVEIVSATAVSPTGVDVEFTTGATIDTATVGPADFDIPGLAVSAATLQPDGKTVRLTTSEQTDLRRYRVSVAADAFSDTLGIGSEEDERGFLGRLVPDKVSFGQAWLVGDTDGRLWSVAPEGFGNAYGQLGDGTYDEHELDPVRVDVSGVGFLDVECSRTGMFAVRDDGTLWAWGDNGYGQLGIGSVGGTQPTPTQVGGGIDWVDVTGGWFATAGIDSAGNLYTWGNDVNGCLGNGASGSVYVPTLVGTGFSQVAVGKECMIAVKTDGSLWGWGRSWDGEINGSLGTLTTPTQMGVATDWIDVAAGGYWVKALNSSGYIYHGGRNTAGVAGQGHTTTMNFTFPTQVTVIDDATEIGGGYYNMLAERADGSIWAWGNGDADDEGVYDSGTPRQRWESGWSLHDAYSYYVVEDPNGDLYNLWGRWEDPQPSLFACLEYLPEIDYVSPQNATTVDVVFDTAPGDLDASSVAAGDFTIAGLTVSDAAVQPDGKTVRLTTSAQTAAADYTVAVAGDAIADSGGSPCEATYGDFVGFASYSYAPDGPLSHTRSIFNMRSPAPDICYAVGMEGYVYKTTNGGANWTTYPGGGTTATRWNAYDISFPVPSDPNTMEMINFDGRINRTTNGGTSWTQMDYSALLGHPNGIDFAGDSGYGVVVNGGNMLRSTDAGASFGVHPAQGTVVGTAVRFADNERGYVVGAGGRVWRSDDGGPNWTEQASPTSANLEKVWVSNEDPNHVVAVGASGAIVYTFDGGEVWHAASSGVSQGLRGIGFADEHVGFAVGAGPTILVTRDGGRSWSGVLTGANGSDYLSGIWARDALNIWVAGLNSLDYKVTGN